MNTRLKEQYININWQLWLEEHKLDSFDAWWNRALTPVDAPNKKRGGWSEVYFFEQDRKALYIKRQENYMCRNFASPLILVPTAKAEHTKIAWYSKNSIPAIEVVYFGWKKSKQSHHQAILVTEALIGFQSLNQTISSEIFKMAGFYKRKNLFVAIGEAVRKLHLSGICHHNLYPKHLFTKPGKDSWEIRFIDLETSRPHFGFRRPKLNDLETLNRRLEVVSQTMRLRAYLSYAGIKKLDVSAKKDIRYIFQRQKDKLGRP